MTEPAKTMMQLKEKPGEDQGVCVRHRRVPPFCPGIVPKLLCSSSFAERLNLGFYRLS